MQSPQNKSIGINKETGKQSEQDFMFPHSPNPITVRAVNIEEATKKFEAIINKEDK